MAVSPQRMDEDESPPALVRRYLAAMERRDLATAQALLAPGFFMIFPGERRFDSLQALVEASRHRYRSAMKTYERYDCAPLPDGGSVVYCFGRLHGELLDGSPYGQIRFIDRFTVRDGKLIDQQVWNDMAEVLGNRIAPLAGSPG